MPRKKLIEKDGSYYRIRRGELVQIPDEWVGQTVYPQKNTKKTVKKWKWKTI